jgi:hypothetical protein
MVSVNFRSNHRDTVTSPKESRKTKVSEKPVSLKDAIKDKAPVCVIDVRQSPYRIVENDRDVVDVCSDDEVCHLLTQLNSLKSLKLAKHESRSRLM